MAAPPVAFKDFDWVYAVCLNPSFNCLALELVHSHATAGIRYPTGVAQLLMQAKLTTDYHFASALSAGVPKY